MGQHRSFDSTGPGRHHFVTPTQRPSFHSTTSVRPDFSDVLAVQSTASVVTSRSFNSAGPGVRPATQDDSDSFKRLRTLQPSASPNIFRRFWNCSIPSVGRFVSSDQGDAYPVSESSKTKSFYPDNDLPGVGSSLIYDPCVEQMPNENGRAFDLEC